MKYETPGLTALTPAINAIQAIKQLPVYPPDHAYVGGGGELSRFPPLSSVQTLGSQGRVLGMTNESRFSTSSSTHTLLSVGIRANLRHLEAWPAYSRSLVAFSATFSIVCTARLWLDRHLHGH